MFKNVLNAIRFRKLFLWCLQIMKCKFTDVNFKWKYLKIIFFSITINKNEIMNKITILNYFLFCCLVSFFFFFVCHFQFNEYFDHRWSKVKWENVKHPDRFFTNMCHAYRLLKVMNFMTFQQLIRASPLFNYLVSFRFSSLS